MATEQDHDCLSRRYPKIRVPDEYQSIYSSCEIEQAISRLGGEISPWAQEIEEKSGNDLLVIPVLRGSIFFFADLARQIAASVALAPAATTGYNADTNERLDGIAIRLEELSLSGRAVLVVDDICDTGGTLQELTKDLRRLGAAEVRTAVLIKREGTQQVFDPDYVGFSYEGPEWFVGYGMDDCGRWRNLPDIYLLQSRA